LKSLFLAVVFLLSFSNVIHAKNERADRGTPISVNERRLATLDLIEILNGTKYFDYVDSRVHGIPEKNSENKYWFGHWWTGVRIIKSNGKVTYLHPETGSDNTGIQTAPYLEGACYALSLTKEKKYEVLTRKMIRGMSAWMLAGVKSENDNSIVLARSFYPESINSLENGREIYFDYEKNRPGKYNGVSNYVHNQFNPFFGDIYLKNERSTDDIGHIIRAIANLDACKNDFSPETKSDYWQLISLYKNWASNVEKNYFIIPTYDLNLKKIIRFGGIGDYNLYNLGISDPMCVEKLALRLMYKNESGNLQCGTGVSELEKILSKYLKNDAIEILRSHHIAALLFAKQKLNQRLVNDLGKGVEERMDRDFRVLKDNSRSPQFDPKDIPSFLIQANNSGVPMTSEEMRLIYQKLHLAKISLLSPENNQVFNVFNESTPDGEYGYDTNHPELYFYSIGTMLGACSSQFRKLDSRQFIDCELLKKELIKR
jgi:hypothetical protein